MPLSVKHIMKIAPIGQYVSLSLNTGEQLRGLVTELGVDHLLIDGECIVSIDTIAKISRRSSSPKKLTKVNASKPDLSPPTKDDQAVPLENYSYNSVPSDGSLNTEDEASTSLYTDLNESVC